MSTIYVNFTKETAPVKPMNAINNGPVKRGRSQFLENFEEYKALKIPYARTHDSSCCYLYGAEHCVDVNGVFPDFDADVNNPASYDFFLTDRYLQTIIEAGTKPYYRLGSRIEHWDKKYNTLPPKDFKKWAQICEHIIAHYNEGWADGFKMNIVYWEIWNEPETEDGQDPVTKNCWGGTKAEFFDFFEIAAKHLKSCFPNLKIGGPALCWEHGWGRDFTVEMHRRGVPLDFYSWHIYTDKMFKYRKDAECVRNYLDEAGYTETESHLNEWNYVADWHEGFADTLLDVRGFKGAAFLAASIIECQHLPVDMMMYYDARPDSGFDGLFDILTLHILKPYYAMLAYSKLADLHCEVESGSDDDCIFSMAAADKSGQKAGMFSYYTHENNPAEKTVTLQLSGCSDNWKFFVTDSDKTFEEIDIPVSDGKANLKIKPQTFVFYKEITA